MSKTPRVKFGNWISTRRARLGAFTLWGWAAVIGGIVMAVAVLVIGQWQLALFVLGATFLYLLLFDLEFGEMDAGRSIAERLGENLRGASRVAAGASVYRTGLFSQLPDEALTALPGALLDMEEIEGIDGEGKPYVLLHHKSVGAIAATYICAPDGTALQPQETIDGQVSKYGAWISSLSTDTSIAGAVVVVDSALTSTAPLIAKIHSEVSSRAPEMAQRALMEAAGKLPARTSDVEAFATVVWARDRLGSTPEDAAAEIASKLPEHRTSLHEAGGGWAEVADSQDLARVVRIAYSPERSREFGTDDLAGRTFRMPVTEAGPDYFNDSQRRVCLHDGVASMSAVMLVPPRMHITEDTFRALFAPQDKFLRKRVAEYFRPLTPGEAVKQAEQLRRSAGVAASAKGMASGFDKHKKKLAEKAENELVEGASMTRFAIQVTVTFEPNEKAYREATTKLKTLLEATNLTYRFVEVEGSAAFHSTLPLGVLPWLYGPSASATKRGGN